MAAGVKDLLTDAGLFHILLVGVGVVGIHDQGHVLQVLGGVDVVQMLQFLEMVVGPCLAVAVDVAPEDGVSQIVAALDCA